MSCTYTIQSNCGSPSFALDISSTAGQNDMGISYIEWNNNKVKTNADISSGSSSIASRYNLTYQIGMPPRNQTF